MENYEQRTFVRDVVVGTYTRSDSLYPILILLDVYQDGLYDNHIWCFKWVELDREYDHYHMVRGRNSVQEAFEVMKLDLHITGKIEDNV